MNLNALAHLNWFQSIGMWKIIKFWILAVAKIHNSEQKVKWYAIFNGQFWIIVHHDPSTAMRREPIICICVPPPQEHRSSASACLCYYETVIYLLRELCTTSPRNDSSTSRFLRSVRPLLLLHDSYAATCLLYYYETAIDQLLRSSAATFTSICRSDVHLKLRLVRPSEVTFSIWSYVHLR